MFALASRPRFVAAVYRTAIAERLDAGLRRATDLAERGRCPFLRLPGEQVAVRS